MGDQFALPLKILASAHKYCVSHLLRCSRIAIFGADCFFLKFKFIADKNKE